LFQAAACISVRRVFAGIAQLVTRYLKEILYAQRQVADHLKVLRDPVRFDVRPRKDRRGVNVISDALPKKALWIGRR
jgi:hypothetical protein